MITTLMLTMALQGSLDARAREFRCNDPQTQVEMNMCADIDFQRADAELNRLWPGLIAEAREMDRSLDRRYDRRPSYEATLRQSQRAWIAFRDAQCTWQSFEARGGSMESMLYGGCRASLTRERIRQLTQPGLSDPAE